MSEIEALEPENWSLNPSSPYGILWTRITTHELIPCGIKLDQ